MPSLTARQLITFICMKKAAWEGSPIDDKRAPLGNTASCPGKAFIIKNVLQLTRFSQSSSRTTDTSASAAASCMSHANQDTWVVKKHCCHPILRPPDCKWSPSAWKRALQMKTEPDPTENPSPCMLSQAGQGLFSSVLLPLPCAGNTTLLLLFTGKSA